MEELHIGYITTKELASWFGISYSYFRKKAEEKYKELTTYCQFKREYGKVYVSEIYTSIYVKDVPLYQEVKSFTATHWRQARPESSTRVADEFMYYNADKVGTRKFSTVRQYVSRAKLELWGRNYSGVPGERGGSKGVFVKLYYGNTRKDNRYEYLTPEDHEKYLAIHNTFWQSKAEELDTATHKYYEGEIDAKEFVKMVLRDDKDRRKAAYKQYQHKLSEELNCDWVGTVSYTKDGICFILEEDENGDQHTIEIPMSQEGA